MFISYDHYRIFYYVARYCSFTKAATALFSNQPNVTRAIKNLEGELGCTLFVRSTRGVSLTPEGETLYEHVKVAFEHLQAGEKELALDRSMKKGVVSIGASEVALHCLLLPILKEFHEIYPGIKIRVSNHSTPQAIAALKSGLVDIAVVTTPTGELEGLRSRTVKSIREVAVCSEAHGHLLGKKVSLSDIAECPVVCLGQQTKTYEFYARIFAERGLLLKPDIEAATSDQILPMVRHGLGVGFVPEQFISSGFGEGVSAIDLDTPLPLRDICMIKRSGESLSIAARELERMIIKTTEQAD